MVYGLQIIMLLDSLIIFICSSGPDLERRSSGGVESRRNEVTERWSGGASDGAEEWNRGVAQRTEREHGGAGAAKQRRSGIAESRSGRSDGAGERAIMTTATATSTT